ncbi:glycosyltransferase family 2 protein [Marinobacter persicus]|uniref:Glycosyltransferase involved in cell wall biosynthesis n=1 Tax=Marinobacter persicus TaxID=930118 RepID=A0A2S6G9U4_9GAMM|nr:glycosyltransferase family 2 protein [Marinobacter persicus]KXS52440.1 MAG: glycosyl transferase family protein [Marinobacter sp. T13-3]PPK53257.1 glycosyltransferase involved in cell wall biosynthesis [Marinobacter persicus]PPK56094.1 glycosyltransferase involved in cell wall biosynthesis [Marinobacter persicus]PPK59689.1 glycosyltransferase involved in cell wall biosynthesis [Marinobacter persicus]
MTFTDPTLSIVVPVHNEADVIPTLLKRLTLVCRKEKMATELLFVDDGSQDNSVALLLQARRWCPEIRVLQLSRNFGKEAAVTAGLSHAKGDAVILIDADLQDPPELIPQMLAEWRKGADVVLMKRRSRAGESWFKKLTASLFYRLINRISDAPIPVDIGDFRLMSRRTVDALNQLPERNRYLKGMFAWVGMPTVTLEFDRDPRMAGQTKWNYLKLLHLAMEGITSFSTRPLRIALVLGLLAAGAGGFFGLWEVLKTLVVGVSTPGYASMIAIVTFLSGVQLLCVGLLGEYVGRIYMETKQRPVFILAEDSDERIPDFQPTLRVAGNDQNH